MVRRAAITGFRKRYKAVLPAPTPKIRATTLVDIAVKQGRGIRRISANDALKSDLVNMINTSNNMSLKPEMVEIDWLFLFGLETVYGQISGLEGSGYSGSVAIFFTMREDRREVYDELIGKELLTSNQLNVLFPLL